MSSRKSRTRSGRPRIVLAWPATSSGSEIAASTDLPGTHVPHTLVQITISRGHDANVPVKRLDRAELLHLSFLQEAKQLGMTSKGSSRSHLETTFPHNTPRSCPASWGRYIGPTSRDAALLAKLTCVLDCWLSRPLEGRFLSDACMSPYSRSVRSHARYWPRVPFDSRHPDSSFSSFRCPFHRSYQHTRAAAVGKHLLQSS